MKSTLMACFTGVCVLSTIYVTYKLYNLTSLLSQISIQTTALNESILETQANTKKNTEDIHAVGKLIEVERNHSANKIRVPEPWEDAPKLSEAALRQKKADIQAAKAKKASSSASRSRQAASAGSGKATGQVRQIAATEKSPEVLPAISTSAGSAAKSNTSLVVLKDRMRQLKSFAQQHNLDKEYALIADMGVSAGKKRLYIVNLSKMAITRSGLMAYNKKSGDNSSTHVYRVEKTGREYYELYSLDNNGEIVSPEPEILSPVSCIPNEETNDFACESEIGPGISPEFFGEVKQLIKRQKNPVILWMFR